jgi:hypothetical protein
VQSRGRLHSSPLGCGSGSDTSVALTRTGSMLPVRSLGARWLRTSEVVLSVVLRHVSFHNIYFPCVDDGT